MTRHFCISARQDSLDRWHTAFPDGIVCQHIRELIGQVGPEDVLWLQLISSSGEQAAEAVLAATILFRGCTVVAMSKLPEQREALLALNAGAKGYCHALSNAETFKQVGIVVSHGGLWIGQELMTRVINAAENVLSRDRSPRFSPPLEQLTAREKAVAIEVAKGAANKEIARTLNITERTVKAHLGSVFHKLNVRDRLQLVLIMNPAGELMGNAA
jgi:two-component system, NarL family, nitrate/nitrite response regulator NarL